MLRAKPDLAAEALAAAKAKASGPLARALLAAAGDDAAAQQELVEALLPVYGEKVLSAKERGAAAALACWGALAGAASEAQVGGTLLPTVVRMTRRNPEPALAAAAPMLAALRWAAGRGTGIAVAAWRQQWQLCPLVNAVVWCRCGPQPGAMASCALLLPPPPAAGWT